jgi:hypothetical protein
MPSVVKRSKREADHSLASSSDVKNAQSYNSNMYRLFQKELHNFESSYKFIQRTCTVFSTIKSSKTHRVLTGIATIQCDSLVMRSVSKRALQRYSKC